MNLRCKKIIIIIITLSSSISDKAQDTCTDEVDNEPTNSYTAQTQTSDTKENSFTIVASGSPDDWGQYDLDQEEDPWPEEEQEP